MEWQLSTLGVESCTRELEKLVDKIEDRIRLEVPSAKYVQVELESPRNHHS